MASTTIVAANNVRRFLFSSSSSTRRVLRSPSSPLTMVSSSLSRTNTTILTRGGDHHDDHTMEPPFHRLPLPSKPLHEEDELIWNDGVAPETAIDFDASHLTPAQGLAWWLGGLGFFFSVYQYTKSLDHPSNKPSAARELPEEAINIALGGYNAKVTRE